VELKVTLSADLIAKTILETHSDSEPSIRRKDNSEGGGEAVRTAERMRDFRTSDRDVAKRRVRARDGASRRSVRNPEVAKEPRSGGEAGRSPGSRGRGDWRPLVGRLQRRI